MKKAFLFCLVCFSYLLTPTITLADSGWKISVQEWDQTGSFDYTLYYPNSSQVISKVILPQNQQMTILNAKYTPVNQKGFIKLQFGRTGAKIKGRGSDSDWMLEGSDTMTDYGELDVFGRQKVLAIHFGTVLIKNEARQTDLYLGWLQQETTNKLKNVVYHLSEGIDVGDQSQPDNGSCLDGEFSGPLIGVNDDLFVAQNMTLVTGLNLSFLDTIAYGHWANHTPAWNWENAGKAAGYEANIGLKYSLSGKIQVEIGYYYNYAKSSECSETLNGVLLPQLVDLEYEQKGWRADLIIMF